MPAFIELLTYKAEQAGITVLVTEESYTSKASFLDRDPLPTYDSKLGAEQEHNPRFSGSGDKRWYRVTGRKPIHSAREWLLQHRSKSIPDSL